eukprot:1968834-Amphidinium_carterae.1
MAHIGWVPHEEGWKSAGQNFSWDEAELQAKWDSAMHLCKEVATKRPDFQTGLATHAYRDLLL